jgi:hypothetical protein
MDQMRQLNIANSYDPEIGGSTWEAYLDDIAGAGNIDPGQMIALAGQYTSGTAQDPSNILGKLLKGMGVDLSGGIAAALNSPSNAQLGLGGVGVLGALAALTSKPSTTSGTTTQSQTSGSTTSGNTNQSQTGTSTQNQTGTSTQDQTGTSTQQQTGTQAQTSETTLPQWYLDLVQQQAGKIDELDPMTAFDKTMLDMPINQYMNPYLEQVADPIMRRMGEDQAAQRQAFDAQRVSRGSFGTERTDMLSNQMDERQTTERGNTLSNLYSQAFGNAQGTATTDLNRMFQEWQAMQQDPRQLAGAQANILTALKPGQITTTAGTTAGTTTGTTAGTTTGTTAGTTTGTTAGTTTGTTGGTTTNTAGTSGSTSYTGTDPNRLGQLAGIAGTVWGLANPNGTTG